MSRKAIKSKGQLYQHVKLNSNGCTEFLSLPSYVIRLLYSYRRNMAWGRGQQGRSKCPTNIFLPDSKFFGYWVDEGQIKESGGNGCKCLYIKDWFKPILPLFLTWLHGNSNFQIRTVDSPPTTMFATLRLRSKQNISTFPSTSPTAYQHLFLNFIQFAFATSLITALTFPFTPMTAILQKFTG